MELKSENTVVPYTGNYVEEAQSAGQYTSLVVPATP